MRTIQTRYIGPRNVRGSRVKATSESESVTLAWDSSAPSDTNHDRTAIALMKKLNWRGKMIGGHTATGRTYVFADDRPISCARTAALSEGK